MRTILTVSRPLLLIVCLLIQSTESWGQSGQRFVVLPPGGNPEIEKGGAWQPTPEDIAGLEARLDQVSHLNAEHWHAIDVHIDHPERYFRQYIGIIRGGKKRIYVNAFCGDIPPPLDWHERLVVIMDGYTCVWQAVYDPIARSFLNLWINGIG